MSEQRRDHGWWGFLSFNLGTLKELAADIDILPQAHRAEVLACLAETKDVLEQIEQRLAEQEAPW